MLSNNVRDFAKRGDAIAVPTLTRVQRDAYQRYLQLDENGKRAECRAEGESSGGIEAMGNVSAAELRTDWQNQDFQAASEKLIVALDVPSIDRAKEIVNELDDLVSFFKIGLHLQMVSGTERFIDDLLDSGRKVFIDYKFADIPDVVKWGVTGSANRKIDFLTVQGTGEVTRDVLRAAVDGKRDGLPKIFFVTLLTSVDDADLQELGVNLTIDEIIRSRVEIALDVGLDGVIASGREARAIRDMAGPDELLIAAPGIRPEGGDQQRTAPQMRIW